MDLLSPDRLASNAYRVLGLPAGAAQAEIEAAARAMRIWIDPRHIAPTPWDLPWLGPVNRDAIEVERALACLAEPQSRLRERLLHASIEPGALSRRVPGQRGAIVLGGPTTGHDAALLDFLARPQPSWSFEGAWARLSGNAAADWRFARALVGLVWSIRDDDYRAWVISVERQGDFQKRTEPAEIAVAIDGFIDSVLDVLSARARDALDGNDFASFDRWMALHAVLGPGSEAQGRHLAAIGDRIEDLLASRSTQIHDDLYWMVNHDQFEEGFNRRAGLMAKMLPLDRLRPCWIAWRRIRRTVEPLLDRLQLLTAHDADRVARATDAAARMYHCLGVSWIQCRNITAAIPALDRARRLAHDPILIENLRDSMGYLRRRYTPLVFIFRTMEAWIVLAVLLIFNTLMRRVDRDPNAWPADSLPSVQVAAVAAWVFSVLALVYAAVRRQRSRCLTPAPALPGGRAYWLALGAFVLFPAMGLACSSLPIAMTFSSRLERRRAAFGWLVICVISTGLGLLMFLKK